MLDLPNNNGNKLKAENVGELKTAINKAKEEWKDKGGHIILGASLKYDGTKFKDLEFNKPLVIRADTVGGSTIEGEGKLEFENAKNVWLYGINFRHNTSEKDTVQLTNCENCVIAGCDFQTTSSFEKPDKDEGGKKYAWYDYLYLSNGDSNCIAYNKFHDKTPSRGHFLLIAGKNKGCTRTVVEYNHFKNHPGVTNGKGNKDKGEALKIGDSNIATKALASVVRYNLFEKCQGDAECVTNKSSCNIYHHNTLKNNMGSLVLRHGIFSIVRDNIFLGPTSGVRAYGTAKIANNTFKSKKKLKRAILGPLILGNGIMEDETDEASYIRAKGFQIENNSFIIDSPDNDVKAMIVTWGRGKGDMKPEGNKFVNNIIVAKSGTILKLNDEAEKANNEFRGNILFNQGSAKYGDILTPDNAIEQCRPPGEMPKLPDRKALQETEVGPKSTRADQPHCSREELQEMVDFITDIIENDIPVKSRDEFNDEIKSLVDRA